MQDITQKEKRIKIARFCGWETGEFVNGVPFGTPPNSSHCMDELRELPNYFGSLDACHETEKMLTSIQFEIYRWLLWDICKHSEVKEWNRAYLSATAPQRAEALYLVISNSKESAENS